MSLLMAASMGYALFSETTDAVHTAYMLASMAAFAWGNHITGQMQKERLFAILNWSGGLLGSVALVIVTPHFFPVALMAVITCVLWAITVSPPNRRILYAGSILTACSIIGISLVMRLALLGAPMIPPAITGATADAMLGTLFITYGVIILQQILRFRDRVETSAASLESTNRDLRNTEQELRKRLAELTQLLEMSRAVGSTMDLISLLKRMMMLILPVVPYGRATVLLLRKNELVDIVSAGELEDIPSTVAGAARNEAHISALIHLRQPLIAPDMSKAIPDAHYSFMAVPLIVRGKFIGVLTLRHSQPGFYTQQYADLCMAFANQVAGMIDSVQLQEAAASAMVIAERHRLARELHDSISQSLFGIVLGTRTAQEQLASAPDAARAALDYSVSLASAALADMRALIFTLRPETLERKGLLAALQAQIDLLQPHHAARIHLDAPDGEPAASLDVKESLYRIAVEALQNALRHSGGSSVHIRIISSPTLQLAVVDDGRGFDPNAAHDGHLGLQSMRERAATLDAAFYIDSAPGRGARVGIALPYAIPEARS
jgi:signal transduction histidine kinase